MTDTYQELVTQFKALMETGERDQWKLAELAYLASEQHGGIKQFAADTGYTANTISKYKKTYEYRQDQIIPSGDDMTFADAYVLSSMGEDRAAAVAILAEVMGKPIGTVKSDTDAINILVEFIVANPELFKEAMKDADARATMASAAFKAATEDVVVEAEGVTKEAAKVRVPEGTAKGIRSVEIQRFKLEVARSGKEGTLNQRRWSTTFESLASDMNEEEIAFIDEQLGLAMMGLSDMRKLVRSHMTAGV